MCCKTYCSTPIQTSHNESQRVTNGPKTLTKPIHTSHSESQRGTHGPKTLTKGHNVANGEGGGSGAQQPYGAHPPDKCHPPVPPWIPSKAAPPHLPFSRSGGRGGAPTRVGDSTFSFRILKLRTPLRGGTRESWRLANVQTP